MRKGSKSQRRRAQVRSPTVSPGLVPGMSVTGTPKVKNELYQDPLESTITSNVGQPSLTYYHAPGTRLYDPERITKVEPQIFDDIPEWDNIHVDWLGNLKTLSAGPITPDPFWGLYPYPYFPQYSPEAGIVTPSVPIEGLSDNNYNYPDLQEQTKLPFALFLELFKTLTYEEQRQTILDPLVQSYKLDEQVQIYSAFILSLKEEYQQERMVDGIVESSFPEIPELPATAMEANERGSNDPEFVCEICHKQFRDRRALMRHMYTHAPRRFTCHICGKRFHQLRDLKRHIETVHPGTAKRGYICKFPGCIRDSSKPFSRRDNAIYHVETVHRVESHLTEGYIENVGCNIDSSDSGSDGAGVGSSEAKKPGDRNYQEHEEKNPSQSGTVPFNWGSPESGDYDDSPTSEEHGVSHQNTRTFASLTQDMYPSSVNTGFLSHHPATSVCEMGSGVSIPQENGNQTFWGVEYYSPSTIDIPSGLVRERTRRSSETRPDPLKAFPSKVQTPKTPPRQVKTRRNSSHSSTGAYQHRRLSSYPQILPKILPRPAQISPLLEPKDKLNPVNGVTKQRDRPGDKLHAVFDEKLQI
ncbi:hypothetical protein AA313_de0206616 [Arthrobotrys entomopaga]|nr:hypothetical protein AA313_de0206616 [Arthrobotrys entomopaga]